MRPKQLEEVGTHRAVQTLEDRRAHEDTADPARGRRLAARRAGGTGAQMAST